MINSVHTIDVEFSSFYLIFNNVSGELIHIFTSFLLCSYFFVSLIPLFLPPALFIFFPFLTNLFYCNNYFSFPLFRVSTIFILLFFPSVQSFNHLHSVIDDDIIRIFCTQSLWLLALDERTFCPEISVHPAKGREDSMRKRDNIVDNIDQSNLSFNVQYQVYRGSVETGPLGGTEVEKNRNRSIERVCTPFDVAEQHQNRIAAGSLIRQRGN